MLRIEIVDHDKIEVGAGSHFAGAEPTERDDRALTAAYPSMRGGKISLHHLMNGTQQHVGEPRKGFAGLFRGHRSGQDARADQKHVLLAEQADGVERGFVAARIGERPAQLGFESRLVRQRAEEARIDQADR